MHSYLIYIGISHINQLTKLYPDLIHQVSRALDEIAFRYDGRSVQPNLYDFSASLNAMARKTAEAAEAMHSMLKRRAKELYGTTVLIGCRERGDFTPTDNIDSWFCGYRMKTEFGLIRHSGMILKTTFNCPIPVGYCG